MKRLAISIILSLLSLVATQELSSAARTEVEEKKKKTAEGREEKRAAAETMASEIQTIQIPDDSTAYKIGYKAGYYLGKKLGTEQGQEDRRFDYYQEPPTELSEGRIALLDEHVSLNRYSLSDTLEIEIQFNDESYVESFRQGFLNGYKDGYTDGYQESFALGRVPPAPISSLLAAAERRPAAIAATTPSVSTVTPEEEQTEPVVPTLEKILKIGYQMGFDAGISDGQREGERAARYSYSPKPTVSPSLLDSIVNINIRNNAALDRFSKEHNFYFATDSQEARFVQEYRRGYETGYTDNYQKAYGATTHPEPGEPTPTEEQPVPVGLEYMLGNINPALFNINTAFSALAPQSESTQTESMAPEFTISPEEEAASMTFFGGGSAPTESSMPD